MFHVLVLILWITKNMALICLYSIHCDKFYAAIEDAEMTCVQLLQNRTCPSKMIFLEMFNSDY